MRNSTFILAIQVAATLVAAQPVEALNLFGWKPFDGDKKPAAKTASTREESSATVELRRGEALENSGQLSAALKVFRQIVKSSELTAAAPKAQLHIGRILERQNDPDGAVKAYKEYAAKYPRGTDFDLVIQSQFNIGKAYLGGRKTRVLLVVPRRPYERAKEVFEEIVKKAPFHRLAPMAQFNVGQALEKDGKPSDAIAAYQEVITRYPGDPVAADAQYQLAYVQFQVSQDGSYDQAARQQAKDTFEEFVSRHPKSEKVSQARENIKMLSGADAKGTLDIAKFYDKTKNYKAAVVYYNEVLRTAPGTKESGQAQKRIDELKRTVGVDVLRAGPERAQSGDMALARRRAQALVDVASRPDFNGPNIPLPPLPGDDLRLKPRAPLGPVGPVPEPALPTVDPLGDSGLKLRSGNPLLPLSNPPPLPTPPESKPEPAPKPLPDSPKPSQ